jgi:CRP/FNR family transcriptional regulator
MGDPQCARSQSIVPRQKPVEFDASAFVADPELVKALEKRSKLIPCEADHVLFRQGDAPVGLYVLHAGEVSLKMDSPRGRSIVSTKAEPNSLLGLPGLIGNASYTLTAIAHAGAQLSFIERDEFMELMQSDPTISFKILRVLAAEVRSARRAIR